MNIGMPDVALSRHISKDVQTASTLEISTDDLDIEDITPLPLFLMPILG